MDPELRHPYLISVCFAKSSADSIGDIILSIVRKAAKFAVYEEMIIKTKNHHTVPITLPENDLQKTVII